MRKILFVVTCLLILCFGAIQSEGAGKKRRTMPHEYGNVLINNFSANAKLPPVVFEHWSHRAKFTCRLCHVDIGFAMKAGGTEIKAAENMKGYFCGTCHNGRLEYNGKKVFESCSRQFTNDDAKRCERCHASQKDPNREAEFYKFAENLPKERFGNGIDWESAEVKGLVKPVDFLAGVSIKRSAMAIQKDFSLNPKVEGLPNIVFSHKKHTVWNGCEVCHPDIFIGVKKGLTKYSMPEIFEGKYCGVCHTSVAFPLMDCQRCHTMPVQL